MLLPAPACRGSWWDRSDLNRDCRFRKPVLYPFKQRPRKLILTRFSWPNFVHSAALRCCSPTCNFDFRSATPRLPSGYNEIAARKKYGCPSTFRQKQWTYPHGNPASLAFAKSPCSCGTGLPLRRWRGTCLPAGSAHATSPCLSPQPHQRGTLFLAQGTIRVHRRCSAASPDPQCRGSNSARLRSHQPVSSGVCRKIAGFSLWQHGVERQPVGTRGLGLHSRYGLAHLSASSDRSCLGFQVRIGTHPVERASSIQTLSLVRRKGC